MIMGVGIDIIDVERISERVDRESGFRALVFSKHEISYCESKAAKFEHYAARFAAKEAFLKALGTGWAGDLELNEIEIRNEKNGRPSLHLLGRTGESLAALNIAAISVSLSHLKTMATAVVILEK